MSSQTVTPTADVENDTGPGSSGRFQTPPGRIRDLPSKAGGSGQLAAETASFRERLLAQQYRARDLFRSDWLRVPGVAPLILLADKALGLVKRLQVAIERRGNLEVLPDALDADLLTDNDTLEDWLQATDVALSGIERQFAYFELTCRLAGSVREVSQRLLTTERINYSDLLDLAESVVESVAKVSDSDSLFPLPGVQMGSVLNGHQPCELPAVYMQGVQTARFAAWTLARRPGWRNEIPTLIVAALFQDVGWLSLRPYIPDANRRGPRRVQWLSQQHPQVGAAILGGVFRAPLALSQTVGLHHERLDGSGYPRRIGMSSVSRMGRMLGCVSRLYELYGDMVLEVRPGDAVSHLTRVAQGLRQEAMRGWWDQEYAIELLEPLPLSDQATPVDDLQRDTLAEVAEGQANRELHGDHPELQGGHAPLPSKGYADFGLRSTVPQTRRG